MEGLTGAERMAVEAEARDKIEAYESVLDTLGKLEGVVQSFDTSDLKAMEELSAEGMECYKAVKDALITKKGNVKTAAVASAIVVAHHYDTLAGYYKKMGQNVTAKQLMDKRFSFSDKAGAGDVYSQQQIDAETKLAQDEAAFASKVDAMLENKLPSGGFIDVMTTPLVMKTIGAELLPVQISYSDLYKVLMDKHSADMTPEVVKQIPRALTDPIMIFDTYQGKDGNQRRVVALDLVTQPKDGRPGASIVVAFELTVNDIHNKYQINLMKTAFGKTDKKTNLPSYKFFTSNIENGKVLYVNTEKATKWSESFGVYFPTEPNTSSSIIDIIADKNQNYKTQNDLEALKKEYSTYYQRAATPEKTLVAYHNISADNLRKALASGGLPVPSIAITHYEIPYDKFGEITLIGTKDMIDPANGTDVYDRDAWTVTVGSIENNDTMSLDDIEKAMLERSGAGGISANIPMLEKAALNDDEGMVRLFAPYIAKKFGSLEEIRNNKEKIKNTWNISEEYDNIVYRIKMAKEDILDTNYDDLEWDIDNNILFYGALIEALNNPEGATLENTDTAFSKRGFELYDFQLEKLAQLANDIRSASVLYFEAKPQRTVKLNEFKGAVVPSGTDSRIIKELERQGLQVEEYGVRDDEGWSDNLLLSREEATRVLLESNDVLFQAAGRSAETANIPMLEKAIELYNNTGDKNRVYEETGWYMGMDGKWRFEIPDNLDKIDVNAFPGKNEEVSLWQIYDNPVLYAAYPWLADVKVYGEELEENTHGQADGESITLNVNRLYPKGRHEFITTFGGKRYYWSKPGITVEDENRKEMPGEYNIAFKYIDEAKASGQPYPSVLERIDMLLQTIDNNLAEAKKKNNIFAINNWEHAQELYGNAKALIESTYGDFESFDYYMEEDLDKKRVEVGKTLIHEIQHLIQREEDFAMGGNPKQVQQQINRQMSKTRDAMEKINKHGWDFYLVYEKYVNSYLSGDMEVVNKAKENYDWFKSFYGVTDEQENKILKLAGEYSRLHDQWMSKDSDFDKYQNLHGEQEARLASRKAELTTQLEAMRESYEKGYEGIYEEWAKTVPEEFKEKGKRLTELRETIDTADENFELSDEMYEEYESLAEIDELQDLNEELQEHELLRIRYEGLQQDYQELVTQGINEFNAIVVFGGNVVAGSALNQQAAQTQGQVKVMEDGMHIITLFESANQSTFMHEMAHVFYDDLRDLAQYDNAPEQVKRDWKNLQLWTAWKDGQLEEYKGTATYNEFKELDAAIRQAQETGRAMYNGKENTLQSLLDRWAQERFARGFEVYLEEGKAPTRALQSAFAKFKNWLTKIYKAVTGAGATPSKEVKEIMDRMLATQDEIDNSIERAKIEAFQKQGLFDYLDGTSQDMWARNMEKIKEDVAVKVQKVAYRDMTIKAKEDREEKLKAEREAAYERISQEPVFVAYQFLKTNPSLNVSDVVETCTDMTVEEYVTELKARGGSLEAAVDQYMKEYEAQLEKPTKAEIRAEAEKAVNDSYYTKLANAFEIQALEQYARDEARLTKKLAGIKAKDEEERKKEEAAVRKLDKEQRQQEERDRNVRALSAETKRNAKLEKEIRELDAKILDLKSQIHAMQTNEKRNKDMRLDEVKSQMQNRVFEAIEKYEYKKKELREEQKKYRAWQDEEGRGKRIYRDALDKYIQKIEKYAEQKMAVLPIKDATNIAMWKKMADEYSDTSLTLFARGEYDLAARQKRIAFFYRHMAHLAEKNKAKVESRVKTLEGHSRTMMKEKNVTANDRYLYNHLMYCFGLANKDALVPPSFKSWTDVLVTYNENLELSYVDQDGKMDLPDWLTSAMGKRENGRYKDGYIDLNMDEMQLLFNVMQNIYKAGREAKNLKTAKDIHGHTVTVEDAVANIVSEAMNNVALKLDRDTTGAENISDWDRICTAANVAHVELLKPETIMRQLGDNAMKYIYNPIKLASDKEMIETEALAAKVRGITEAWEDGLLEVYTNMTAEERNNLTPEKATAKAIKEMRTKKQYKLGTSNLTKENVIALALNWGTELNRKRVLDGFNVTPSQVEKVLEELNAADWQMVINIWELFDDYWPRLVEVEANCSGVVMEKQQALPFSVIDKSGFTYNIKGGYYPIRYNLAKEGDIGNKVGDEAKRVQMSDQSRLSMGMGSNKERKDEVKRKIRLDFGVFSEVISEDIHQIAMREAIRDVNRIVRDKGFEDFIKASYGQATLNMLQNWVLDCWKKEPQVKNMVETVARWFRENQTVAVLGYRTTTALLNTCNISYVIDYLGPVRAVNALKTFYAHPKEQYAFALEKSVFLRDRAETMDRDMGDVLKRQKSKPGDGVRDFINTHAFTFITATDLMLACPLWVSEYQRAYQEAMDKKLNPEQAEREAVLAGDAGVRRVFGSGLIQDQANIQKRNEFTKMLTMYYSFFSVMHNALMMKVFEARQAWRKSAKTTSDDGTTKVTQREYKDMAKALAPIATGVIFWMVIPAAMETVIRAWTGGDDKDKEAKNLAKKTLTTIAGTAVGGIPLFRDWVPAMLEWYMGGRYYGTSSHPMLDFADKVQRVLSAAQSSKKTKFDFARDASTVISSAWGVPQTALDTMVSAAQFIDHGKLTTDDILHYMWAIFFDKNPDKKK